MEISITPACQRIRSEGVNVGNKRPLPHLSLQLPLVAPSCPMQHTLCACVWCCAQRISQRIRRSYPYMTIIANCDLGEKADFDMWEFHKYCSPDE
eukprot:347426-Chlamydomonas_euryale.AAC.1